MIGERPDPEPGQPRRTSNLSECSYGSCSTLRAKRSAFRAYAICGAACCASLSEGYQLGVFPAVLARLSEVLDLQPEVIGSIAAIIMAGRIMGALASGTIADGIGRKLCLCTASLCILLGILMMGLAPGPIWLMAGRFVTGFGTGITPVGSIYVVETAPPDARGTLGTVQACSTNFGIAVGGVAGALLQDTWQDWRVMLLAVLPLIVVTILILVIPWLPDSPTWYVGNKNIEMAKDAFMMLGRSEREAADSVSKLRMQLRKKNQDKVEIVSLAFGRTAQSKQIRLSIGVSIGLYLCGTSALITSYAPAVLAADLGRKDAVNATAVINMVVFAALMGVKLSDLLGRRLLLIASYLVLALSYLLIGVLLSHVGMAPGKTRGHCIILVLAVMYAMHFAGFSPASIIYAAEVAPSDIRAKVIGLAQAASSTVAMSMLYVLAVVLERSTWLTFTGLSLVTMVNLTYLYLQVKETAGIELEEVRDLFGRDVSRQFSLGV